MTRDNGHGSLPELPDGWKWETMREISVVVGGSTPKSKEPEYWGGDIPWLGVADLTDYDDMYIGGGTRSITQAGYDSCATQKVPPGTVLFSSRAPIGYVAIATNELCTSQGFKSFIPGERVSSAYLYWWLRHATPIANSMASGTTFKELSGKRAADIPVPVPPPDEQHRLVALIDDLLGRITSGEGDVERGLEGIHLFERSSVAQIAGRSSPPRVRLDEVGQVSVGATPRRSEASFWGGDIPWVSSGEVAFNRVASTQETITETGLGDRAKRLQPAGSVLIAMYGDGKTRGRAAILDIDAATNQAVASVRIDPGRAVPEFVYNCLVQQYEAIRDIGSGTQQKNLSKGLVAAIEIPCPPLHEQREAVKETQALHSKTRVLREEVASQRDASARLRRAVLNSAFVGHL